jgi:hypothetical protein
MKIGLVFVICFLMFVCEGIEAASRNAVTCRSSGDDAVLYRGADALTVVLRGYAEACESGFEFDATRDGGYLLLAPKELGERAKGELFEISFKIGAGVKVGDLPVTAERIATGIYRDVYQVGNSIYREIYKVEGGKLVTDPSSGMLVVEGRLCVSDPKDVWQFEVSMGRRCKKLLTASFEKPVCLSISSGRARLALSMSCHDQLHYLRN